MTPPRKFNCASPAYFLSDCHLPLIANAGQESWMSQVLSFLREEATRGATLFLVGDMFDFWFEWRHSVPAAVFPALAALHELTCNGVQVIYLAGNHDGHPGRFLEREVGLAVSRREIDADIDGARFHIAHGDGLDPTDWRYRGLRAVLRWKLTESFYRLLHPDFGIWFAHKVSYTDWMKLEQTPKDGTESYQRYAMKKLDEGYNYVVMGHRHESGYYPHDNGGFLSIGDWIRRKTYGRFADGRLELLQFDG